MEWEKGEGDGGRSRACRGKSDRDILEWRGHDRVDVRDGKEGRRSVADGEPVGNLADCACLERLCGSFLCGRRHARLNSCRQWALQLACAC